MASRDTETGPERWCIASGQTLPKAALIRFCVAPDGTVTPDLASKLPGRGIYVAATRSALDRACDKGLFGKAARQKVTVPSDLVATLETMLASRVVASISLARKAGRAVAGYEKVKAYLDREAAEVLMQACDGSERGKSKLSTPHFGTYIGWLTADELGAAFGRDKVIHAALASGGLTQRVVTEAHRLRGLRDETAAKLPKTA